MGRRARVARWRERRPRGVRACRASTASRIATTRSSTPTPLPASGVARGGRVTVMSRITVSESHYSGTTREPTVTGQSERGVTDVTADARREGLGTPRRPSRRRRAGPPLRRPPPRPRGHQRAGVRRAAAARPPVRRPDLTVATMDHNVPTTAGPVTDEISKRQMDALSTNAEEFDITLFPMGSPGQGIVHVIGPEQGYTQPGLVIVCGDSHTSTHGAFGALAFGIGTSRGRARAGHADAPADASRRPWRSRSTASCRPVSPRRT